MQLQAARAGHRQLRATPGQGWRAEDELPVVDRARGREAFVHLGPDGDRIFERMQAGQPLHAIPQAGPILHDEAFVAPRDPAAFLPGAPADRILVDYGARVTNTESAQQPDRRPAVPVQPRKPTKGN